MPSSQARRQRREAIFSSQFSSQAAASNESRHGSPPDLGLSSADTVPGEVESDRCLCGRARETVYHVLLNCGRYDGLRREVWRGAALRNLEEALTDKKKAQLAAQFMLRTGRLTYLEGDTRPTKRPEPEPAAAPTYEGDRV